MSDAAARRRQRILQAAGNRMAVVSGLASGPPEGEPEEAAASTSAAAEATAPASSSTAGSSGGGGSNRARMRRLQSRNIVLEGAAAGATTTTTEATEATEAEEAEPVAAEAAEVTAEPEAPAPAAALAEATEKGSETGTSASASTAETAPAPAATSLPSLSSAGSSGSTFTTGGNTLRRRFHASKSSLGGDEDLGLDKEDKDKDKEAAVKAPAHPILAAQQQRSAMRRLLDTALTTEAGLRFLLVFVGGLLAGLWAVAANAGVVAEGFEQRASADGGGSAGDARAALDAFVSGGSAAGASATTGSYADASSKGVLGWVRGLFLPPAFDSWPLPLLAVGLHLVAALVAPLVLRLRSNTAAHKRAAILSRMPTSDGIPPVPPPPGAQGAGGSGGGGAEQSKSLMETMAHSMGLGPLLELFKLAQAAWQDVLLFSFAFLAAVALASASEHLLALLVGGAGPADATLGVGVGKAMQEPVFTPEPVDAAAPRPDEF